MQTKEKIRDYNKKYIANLRKITVDLLGGKCARCEFDDPRALQIDHINGGGVQELSKYNCRKKYYEKVRDSFENKEGVYQILCANCNWIKRTTHHQFRIN